MPGDLFSFIFFSLSSTIFSVIVMSSIFHVLLGKPKLGMSPSGSFVKTEVKNVDRTSALSLLFVVVLVPSSVSYSKSGIPNLDLVLEFTYDQNAFGFS